MGITYDVIIFLSNTFVLRKPRVENFATLPCLLKPPLIKDSRKAKRIKKYVLKCNLYLYFFIYFKSLISGEKVLMPAELKEQST